MVSLAGYANSENGAKYGDKRLRKRRKYYANTGKARGKIPAVEFKS